MRYVDANKDICELFMEFAGLERITGEAIGGELHHFYESLSIGVKQCHDGSPNMQSLSKGAVTYVLDKSPKPVSCSIMQNIINNIIETYKAITIFFNTSPKREGLLEDIVQIRCDKWNSEKRKVVIGMCKTRWSERDVSYRHFSLVLSHCRGFRGNQHYPFPIRHI